MEEAWGSRVCAASHQARPRRSHLMKVPWSCGLESGDASVSEEAQGWMDLSRWTDWLRLAS